MIICKICKKFAKAHSISFNPCTEEIKNFKVVCKRHGIAEGDYTDFEELPFDFYGEK